MKYPFFVLVVFLLALPVKLGHAQSPPKLTSDSPIPLFKLLDGNHDGILDPYEALDVLSQVEFELDGKAISSNRIAKILKEIERDELEEISEMLSELDVNNDGKTTLAEMDEEMRGFAEMFDEDEDGVITVAEVREADFEDQMFMTPEEIRFEVDSVFHEFDENKDGNLVNDEANEDEFSWSQMSEGDTNRDGKVTKSEMIAFITADNQRAEFKIVGDTAVMSGVICSDTPAKVLRLFHENPSVHTIEMKNVPGSIDDEANLRAAGYVRKFGFATTLKANGSVASGGTDFFLAGRTRTFEPGAKFGIHSWGGPGFQGKDVPRDDPQHQLYLNYYEEMGIPAEFYWRTLEAAPANDIHWMTDKELVEFEFRTTESKARQEAEYDSGKEKQPSKNADGDEKPSTKNQLRDVRKELTESIKELAGEYQLAATDELRGIIIAKRRAIEKAHIEKAIALYPDCESKKTILQSMSDLASMTKGEGRHLLLKTAIESHCDSEEMSRLLFRVVQNGPAPDVHAFLSELADRSPHREIKAWAIYYQANMANSLRGLSDAEKARLLASFGESFAVYDEKWSGDDGEAKVLGLLDVCEKEYADVASHGQTIGDLVAAARVNLSLTVGKLAPDIVGEDLDGVSFKLSDYRGKVVLLDFWGDW